MNAWKCNKKLKCCPDGGCLLIAGSMPVSCTMHFEGTTDSPCEVDWTKIELWEGFDCGWHPFAKSRVYSNANLKQGSCRDGMASGIPADLDYYQQEQRGEEYMLNDAWNIQLTTFIFAEPWKKPDRNSRRVNGIFEEIPEQKEREN